MNLNRLETKCKAFKKSDKVVEVTEEALDGAGSNMEMPGINYKKFNGKKYRYFYTVGIEESIGGFYRLIKVTTAFTYLLTYLLKKCLSRVREWGSY